eukprot:5305449-Prymnesium_polylepis.1
MGAPVHKGKVQGGTALIGSTVRERGGGGTLPAKTRNELRAVCVVLARGWAAVCDVMWPLLGLGLALAVADRIGSMAKIPRRRQV